MRGDLLELVEREINNNVSPEQVKDNLLQQGFLEDDIDNALKKASSRPGSESRKLSRIFATKEVFDRIGYGFVPHQFINILFYLTGANFVWLGALNGARAVLSMILSSIFQEYTKVKHLSKGVISKSGYLFGFSFLGMAFATLAKSVPLFALFLLLGGVGVVTHGDLYQQLVNRHLKREKRGKFLARITHFGVLITGACMLLSGWLMDKFPVLGSQTVEFLGNSYPLLGYLIIFEITAISFILSGYVLSHVKEKKPELLDGRVAPSYFRELKKNLRAFLGNLNIFLLLTTTILLGIAQVLGNSYYGVFIYENFKGMAFGGFMNVAAVYFVAILASFLGPGFSKWFNRHTGLAPTLVFGTLLVSLMPLTLAYNPNLVAIGAANALSVVGAAILGVSQGLLATKLLREKERKTYFSVASIAGVLPFIILIPLGAYYAQINGLVWLFKMLGIGLAAIVAPLYVLLVVLGSKNL